MRPRFLRRVGLVVAFVFLLLFAASGLTVGLLSGVLEGRHGAARVVSAAIGLALLLLAFAIVGRAVRRMARPVGDVMEAADRVAGGDLAARVEPRGYGAARQLGSSFNEMASRLEANEQQRRNLLADVTHELRTPLSVIRGNVEGMLDGLYQRDDDHLAPVLEETKVMARLLDDLRTLSTAEAGALQLHREPTDVSALVADVVEAFAPRAAEAGVALTEAVATLPELDVDPVRVRQVLENLVTNALRHTPRGGSIAIEVGPDGQTAAFSVADTGPGIAPDELRQVFDRFAKSADSHGSGLGLAIAKSLVEAHGGEIHAASEVGHGTTIRFALPMGEP
jgi:signal transduction histidine kinase